MCARDTGVTTATGFLPEEVINARARLCLHPFPSPNDCHAAQPVGTPEQRAQNLTLEAGLVPSSAADQVL